MQKQTLRRRMHKLGQFCFSSQQRSLLSLQILVGMFCSIITLVIFLELSHKLFENELGSMDLFFSYAVYQLRSPLLTQIMMLSSLLGSEGTVVISFLMTIVFLLRKHKNEAFLFSLTLVLGALANLGLKLIVQRPRPHLSPLVPASFYSFPSGHAMNSFLFFALFSYYSFHFWRNRPLTIALTALSAFIVLGIGFSRVYLGVHYPSDVLAGYVAGFWIFLTVLCIGHGLQLYRWFKRSE